MALKVGDAAPDFELYDTDLKPVTLGSLRGDGRAVLSFFVAASSPVCERELCAFRDSLASLEAAGARVAAISNDGPFANKAFAEKHGISYPVLSDHKSRAIRDYGVLMPDLLHIKGYDAAKRSVFVVNADGKIGYAWVSDDPLVEPDYAEIMEFLKK